MSSSGASYGSVESPDRRGVLIVTPWFRPDIGGIVDIADRLSVAFEEAGVPTRVLVTDQRQSRLQRDDTYARVWRLGIPTSFLHRATARSLGALVLRGTLVTAQLAALMRRERIATVVLLSPIDSGWPFPFLCDLMRRGLVTIWQGTDILMHDDQPRAVQWLIRRMLIR